MTRKTSLTALLLLAACSGNGGTAPRVGAPGPLAGPVSPQPDSGGQPRPEISSDLRGGVSATILPGRGGATPPAAPNIGPRSGDISLNFPGADIAVVAKVVMGDILKAPYAIAPGVTGHVSLVTQHPIARADLLSYFEEALRAADMALVTTGGVYNIVPAAQARNASAAIGRETAGFGSETVSLRFVSAAEMVKLIAKIMPGVVGPGPQGGTVSISGTTGQRRAAHDLIAQFDVNWLQNMSFGLFVPQNTDGRLIVPELNKLLNDPAARTKGLVRLIAMEKLNGILAISQQPQYLEDVGRWVEILDREGVSSEQRLFVYHVQNGRSADLAKTLNGAFGNSDNSAASASKTGPSQPPDQTDPAGQGGNGAGLPRLDLPGAIDQSGPARRQVKITSDEANNAVIVFATPREYAIIEKALLQLDILPLQVMIEAAITEVTLTNDLRYGVQWQFQAGDANFAQTVGDSATPTRIFPGFSFFYTNNDSISATLNALENLTKVNVVSAPKLMVLNNQTASLQVGDQVPVATASSVGTQNANSPIVNSIEYRDTGVILKITPRVNDGGLVLLDIAQEVSSVATTSTSTIDSPTIQTRRISSSVAVHDGQIIALGGLIRDNSTKGKNGLPVLSRIPIFGSLFGTHTDKKDRTELLVLIKPRVIRSVNDGQAVTDELRAKLHSIEPLGASIP